MKIRGCIDAGTDCIHPFHILFSLFSVDQFFWGIPDRTLSRYLRGPLKTRHWMISWWMDRDLSLKETAEDTVSRCDRYRYKKYWSAYFQDQSFLGISHSCYSGIHIYVHVLSFFSFLKYYKYCHFLCVLKLFWIFPPELLQHKNAKLRCLKWSLIVRAICYFLCFLLTVIILDLQ